MKWKTLIIGSLISGCAFAIPFNIIPKPGTTLPTVIPEGQEVAALYVISNNSSKTLTDNYIQYLPPHVTQVTDNTNISDLCGKTFNLTPRGSTSDSCTLQLSINGPVSAGDPNPQNHLFACLPGGKSCAGTNYPLNVQAVPAAEQLVAVGSQNNSQGIIFVSQNQGENWLFQALAYPESVQTSSFSGSSCSSPNCVIAGSYEINTSQPGVATAENTMLTNWMQQILTTTNPNANATLNGINCNHMNCIAVGLYDDGSSATPLITKSTDAGLQWTEQTLPLINPQLYALGYLAGVNCAGSVCAAVGSYFTQDYEQYASIAYSMDGGSTWLQQVLPWVEGTSSNQLNGVSCVGLTCIAVGDYLSNDTENDLPGIAITNNGGATWQNSVIQTFPEPYNQGEWQAISCTSSLCVAVGYYSNISYVGYLGIATSTDLGKTWTQQALAVPTDPPGLVNGVLYGVKCSNTCVATGSYFDNANNLYPVFVTSSDGGQTWTQQVYGNYAGILMNGIG